MCVTSAPGELDAGLTDAFGGALMNGAWVDLPKLMSDVRAELLAAGSLTEAAFDPADAVTDDEGISWRHVRAAMLARQRALREWRPRLATVCWHDLHGSWRMVGGRWCCVRPPAGGDAMPVPLVWQGPPGGCRAVCG